MDSEIFKNFNRVIVTGGSGFIGSHLISKLLKMTDCEIYNIDKMGYASDETLIKKSICSCLLYTSPSPRDLSTSRMPSSA